MNCNFNRCGDLHTTRANGVDNFDNRPTLPNGVVRPDLPRINCREILGVVDNALLLRFSTGIEHRDSVLVERRPLALGTRFEFISIKYNNN